MEEFILTNPLKVSELWMWRFYYFWKPVMDGFNERYNRWNFVTVLIPQILSVFGIIYLVACRRFHWKYWVPFFVVMSNATAYTVTFIVYEKRYLMPLLPFVYFYAGIGSRALFKLARYKRGESGE